jgi:hypothetical protein
MKKTKPAAKKGKPASDRPEEKYKPTAREQEAIDAFATACLPASYRQAEGQENRGRRL